MWGDFYLHTSTVFELHCDNLASILRETAGSSSLISLNVDSLFVFRSKKCVKKQARQGWLARTVLLVFVIVCIAPCRPFVLEPKEVKLKAHDLIARIEFELPVHFTSVVGTLEI